VLAILWILQLDNKNLQRGLEFMKLFKKLMNDESGATAIEYGLIAALISIAAIVAMTTLGDSLKNSFGTVSNTLTNAQR
jgi:pilus assembly protein Flp/PilA